MANKVLLFDSLDQSPGISSSNESTKFAKFFLAAREQWKNKQGNAQQIIKWCHVIVFQKYPNRRRKMMVLRQLRDLRDQWISGHSAYLSAPPSRYR